MSRQNRAYTMPPWLWFFLVLPIALIVGLIYRRNRWTDRVQRRLPLPRIARRYIEPDSIPLNLQKQPGSEFVEDFVFETSYETYSGPKEPVVFLETEVPPEMLEPLDEEPVPASAATETTPDAGPAAMEREDNLQVIEGIGPKIAGLLRESGITSFHQLAGTSTERLVEILTQARLNRLAAPGTWPEQAQLAADGQWEALATLQDTLKGGRRVS